MNRTRIYFSMLFMLISAVLYPQCNQQLVEKAAGMAGTDAIYLRDFKVKLSEGNMDEPAPTGKFPVFLNKGVNYRFTVANATEFEGRAYLELSRRGQSYIDNMNPETGQYQNSFDFSCPRSGTYQLLLNFGSGNAGCAAVVMSMILQDSMEYIEPGISTVSDSAETLFLWAENELQIATSEGRDVELRVSVSQGNIKDNGRFYSLKPEHIGELKVKVDVLVNDTIAESDSVLYQVVYPPLPNIIFPGYNTNSISKRELTFNQGIKLEYPVDIGIEPYVLKNFSVSKERTGFKRETSEGNKLSYRQISIIKETPTGDAIYLNVTFEDINGKTHTLNMIEYVVRE